MDETRPVRSSEEMEERKESDLESLERRSNETLNSIREARCRLSNLLDSLRKTEQSEEERVNKEVPIKNRLNIVENTVDKINNESAELNSIIAKLEEILR